MDDAPGIGCIEADLIQNVELKIAILRSRIRAAYALLHSCRVCPRGCGVNRIRNETGFCGAGYNPVFSSDTLHHGEEPPISGTRGSGTIFLTGCNLGCIFCQNFPISHLGHGNRITIRQLSDKMLRLQKAGAHNINLVTPTHFAPQIMAALFLAYKKGLHLPIVYNCGGYESMDMLRLWDGIVDIYMPDMKYSDGEMARVYSSAPDYPEINRAAVLEMFRQVGDLELDPEGIAEKGLLIRHLVLPENISGTGEVLRFISERISRDTYISLMSQYFPAHEAQFNSPMNRRITKTEYETARRFLQSYRLRRGWVQG
jgi:putative pyruvate formate lyase activating enzyme